MLIFFMKIIFAPFMSCDLRFLFFNQLHNACDCFPKLLTPSSIETCSSANPNVSVANDFLSFSSSWDAVDWQFLLSRSRYRGYKISLCWIWNSGFLSYWTWSRL
jgi:hypothetical protein